MYLSAAHGGSLSSMGLEYYAAFPGCSTEIEASMGTVKFLIDKINTEKNTGCIPH